MRDTPASWFTVGPYSALTPQANPRRSRVVNHYESNYTQDSKLCQIDNREILWYIIAMKQITVRMPDEMYKQVNLAADMYERSVNSQIVWILKQWLQGAISAGLPAELDGLPSTMKQEASSGNA